MRQADPPDEPTEPHYKIRLIFRGGAMIHLASSTTPLWVGRQFIVGEGMTNMGLEWDPIEELGDTVGYIDWDEVAAVSWRWHP